MRTRLRTFALSHFRTPVMSEAVDQLRTESEDEWYERWFGEEYLHLYGHRDQEEAARAVELVLDHHPRGGSGRALDLACGAGRHVLELDRRGMTAFGLDLSLPLLHRAVEQGLPVVRGDMRHLPFAAGSFSLVTSFFTSFAYFDDAGDDHRVLDEIRRVLEPTGTFALDFMNAERVREELSPRNEREVNGRLLVETRRLVEGGHVVEKEIDIHDRDGGAPRVYHERVRLYEDEDLLGMFALHGFEAVERFGDYDGAPLTPDSPRVIFLGRQW